MDRYKISLFRCFLRKKNIVLSDVNPPTATTLDSIMLYEVKNVFKNLFFFITRCWHLQLYNIIILKTILQHNYNPS